MSFTLSSVLAVVPARSPASAGLIRSAPAVRPAARMLLVVSVLLTSVACAPSRSVGLQSEQPVAAPSLNIKKDIDLVRLQGVFSSADEAAMVYGKAVAAFGAEMIINDLQVDQRVAPAQWLDTVMQTAENMQEVPGFSIAAGSGQMIIGGAVDSKREADLIADMAGSMAGTALAVSSSMVYPVAVDAGSLAGAELVDMARARVEQVRVGDVIPDNVLEQPAVAIQQPDFKVIPAVAVARDTAPAAATFGALDMDGDGVTDDLDECQSRPGYPVNERGCQLLDGYLDGVRFYSTTNELTAGSRESLDEIAGVMQQHPQSKIAVISFSKDDGALTDDRVQARMRAFSVVDYLVSRGIDKHRLSAFALGDRKGIRDQIMIKEVD